MRQMSTQRPQLAQEAIFQLILQPLYRMMELEAAGNSIPGLGEDPGGVAEGEVVPEGEVATLVSDLHTLITHDAPTEALLSAVTPVLRPLFRLFCAATMGKANIRRPCRQVVMTYFRLCPSAAADLTQLIVPPEGALLTRSLEFGPGPSGGLCIRCALSGGSTDYSHEAECAVELLQELDQASLAGDVFLGLLEEAMKVQTRAAQGADVAEQHLMLLQTVATCSETLGPAVLQKPGQSLQFVASMLDGADQETGQLAVALLVMFLGGEVQIPREDWPLLDTLVPMLEALEQDPEGPAADAAKHCRISIVTRDKAWSASTSSAPPSPGVATMRQVLKDIQHEEIPIRAYGLAKLREMVLAKDPTALAHVDSIIIIFGSQLEDSDQFVYLRAVDGLAAIGDVRPALAVPELAGQYTKSGVETPTRLKIGQAMLLVRGMGL